MKFILTKVYPHCIQAKIGYIFLINDSGEYTFSHYNDNMMTWDTKPIKDYSTMSEEELFQESTIYDLTISLSILAVLQQCMKVMHDYRDGAINIDINEKTLEVDYYVDKDRNW